MEQRPVLPPRSDLTRRHQRVIATAAVRGEHLVATVKQRVLVEVPPPADDPFYRVPEGLDAVAPGEVLDHRSVEIRSFRRELDVDAWQVAFRSTGVQGEATSGVATVMVPRRSAHRVRPLLSYQCAIDALGPTADPSYTLRHGDQLELPFVTRALRRGWAVVTTDYNGPQHAFCAFPLVAHFVLDGIRAAVALEPAGLAGAATPIGLWGYSGGALATLFAVERQAAYAPELDVVGAAAGGAGVDITSSPQMFEDGNLLSGIPFGAVIGVSRGFPDVDLRSVLTPRGRAMVDAAADMTMEELVASFPFVRWSDHLTVPSVLDVPGMRAAFETGRLGQATPVTALHLYHAVHDKYPPVEDVDRLVAHYRSEGVDVAYRRHRVGGHMAVSFAGAPGALRFLGERFGDR